MNRFEKLRSKANQEFGSEPEKQSVAQRAVDHLEIWCQNRSMGDPKLATSADKRECKAYIKQQLYKDREENFGFIGILLSSVLFSVIVQLISRWIVNTFFS